jgi:hypothetical protein
MPEVLKYFSLYWLDDDATRPCMVRYYTLLKQGKDLSEAVV